MAAQHTGFLFSNKAREQSELLHKLDEMVEYFEDMLNHNDDEALENAWKNREYQFKKLLTKQRFVHAKLAEKIKNIDGEDPRVND